MKVLVTGGAGFIGSNLVRALAARNDEVRVLDDLSTGDRENLTGTAVEFFEGSILDRDLLATVSEGIDAVVHLAARPSVPRSLQDPVASHAANATGTLYVLEAARAANAHMIVASSSSVYGSTVELPKHEALPTRPLSPYGASKLATEAYALAYAESFGLPVLSFRFFNVYGPLQAAGHAYAAVIPTFVDHALRRQPLPVYGDGQQTRDFTYVGTVVSVIADALARGVSCNDPVNLAFGTRISLLDLVKRLSTAVDMDLEISHEPARRGDIRDSQAANDRLRSLFPGVDPVPLEDGLARTVEWFRSLPAYR
jgi:UDP-glucose 4-epimerase